MEQEARLGSSLLESGGRETNLCSSEKICFREPVNPLLLRTARASGGDGEENSMGLEQGSPLHRRPEML